jgi:integrase
VFTAHNANTFSVSGQFWDTLVLATIVKRENGTYQVRIRRRGYPEESRRFARLSEAEAWAREVETKIDKHAHIPTTAAKGTLSQIAKRFSMEFAPHHYRGAAWQFKLDKLLDRLGDYSLVAITPTIVAGYRDERLKDSDSRYKSPTAKTPRVSSPTVKSELDLLSKVLDVAQKEFEVHLPNGNPVVAIRKPKGAKSRTRRLTSIELKRLIRECEHSGNPWLAPSLTLAIETAMRQGELLSLEWSDVREKDSVALLLDPAKIKTEEPRAVPLSDAALAVLKGLPGEQTGRVIKTGRMTLYKAFERACARAEIIDFTWHDLRHEALSRIAERGDFNLIEMAAVSGHKTLQMLKRYTHLQAGSLAKKLSRPPGRAKR